MATGPTALDDFIFDLNGYLILRGVVQPDLLARINAAFDRLPDIETGEWVGNSQRRDYTRDTGYELHNCIEFDPSFEELIDHPGWISHVWHYCGEERSYVEGVFIDENIASIRRSGGHHPVHSGGFGVPVRCQYKYEHGQFRCGQVNIIVAYTDIGPEDGPTMVVPGSHKSNFHHPLAGDYGKGDRMDALPGAIPVLMRAGDVLLFVDAIMHGGSSRTRTDGERRITIFRYGPSWATTRYGYQVSDELFARLTPERRHVMRPVPAISPGEKRIPESAPGNR